MLRSRRMPAARPPPRRSGLEAPAPHERAERTDPGGPAPEVLQKARRDSLAAAVQPAPGAATLIYDKNKGRARAAESPRLVVTAGPRKGMEHALVDELTTIGRGEANVLVIPDISVSRQHSRIERQGEKWVVLDQGSGNGTRVNGKQVERFPLRHGDEIEMGDTRLEFAEPTASNSALRRRAPIYGAVAAALLIVFAAGLVKQRRQEAADAAAEQGDESRAFAQKRFQEGVALLKAGKWVEARDKLKIAAELDAQDPEIARYLESAESEAPRAQQLDTAKAALQRGDYAGVRGALAGVPDDSALAESAQEIAQQLRDALAVKEANAGQRRTKATVRRRERQQPVPAPSQPAAPEVQSILDAYLAGDLGAALERARGAQSPRGERLLADLKAFDAASRDGFAQQQARRPAEALRALEQAAAADREIAQGKDGRLGREVHKALSALHTQLGAAQAGSDEGLPQAAEHLRAAVQDDPSNEAAQAQLQQVGDRCKQIYLSGYVTKDDDVEAARQAFKLVIAALPPSDETAQKARRWLDKLDGKVSQEE